MIKITETWLSVLTTELSQIIFNNSLREVGYFLKTTAAQVLSSDWIACLSQVIILGRRRRSVQKDENGVTINPWRKVDFSSKIFLAHSQLL